MKIIFFVMIILQIDIAADIIKIENCW